MDYPYRHRIKIWGEAEFVEGDEELLTRVADPEYAARPQRVLRFRVKAWDVNCNHHIQQRFTEDELPGFADELKAKIAKLEAKNAEMAAQLRLLKRERAA